MNDSADDARAVLILVEESCYILITMTVKLSSVVKAFLLVRKILGSNPRSVKRTQCRQRLATTATFLRSCAALALSRGDVPATRSTLPRKTASITKF